ncbi:MAG: potassium channel protein [Bryobacteraceae bacterium]|nr:potassium channel protein [Bryobacteraceae bacterium]
MPLLLRRGFYLLAAVAAVLAIGTSGFMWIEGAAPFDAFYMALITMTTVGYGETVPLGQAGRVFNSFYLLVSVSLLFASIGVFTLTLVELQLGDMLGQRKVRKMISSLEGHFIVCGLGRVGRGAADELHRSGVPFVIVDKSDDRVERAIKAGMLAVSADATRDETLREVNIDQARGLIAALSSDADNLFLTLSAKTLNPKLSVSARVNEEEAEKKIRRAGADAVIAPYNFTGSRLAQSILRPHVSEFLNFATQGFGDDVAIEQVRVEAHAEMVGKSLLELGHLRKDLGLMVLAVRQSNGQMLMNPPAEHVILAGDYLIVMGEYSKLRNFEKLMR